MPRKKSGEHDPPQVIETVGELPPPMRGGKGESVYDDVILQAAAVEGAWLKVDPKGRSLAAFRNGVIERAEKLELDTMQVRVRGNFVYIRYQGGENVKDMIERVREEARAIYGE